MRNIVVTEFLSLDGVMEGPGPADPYEHAGWTMQYWSDEIGKIKYDELFESDGLLLGRRTYDGFAAAWPSQSDPQGFADRMNSMPKYVASNTLRDPQWQNSQVIEGDLARGVRRLKEQPGQNILIAGSSVLAQSLAAVDLVDEYRLLVYPVVLGSGKRLFGENRPANLELCGCREVGGGVVYLCYRRGR